MEALNLNKVTRRVPGMERPLLRDVCLRLERGEWLNLVGPSGSGKSSLLRILNRLDETDAGVLEVLGKPLVDWPVRTLRRKVALVFQQPHLGHGTTADALAVAHLAWGLPRPTDTELGQALERVGLPARLLQGRVSALSGGERQRVALARALLTGPEILLLDEPTSGLDEQAALPLLEQLRTLGREAGLTVLVSNHRLAEVRRMGGRMAVLMDGALAAVGDTANLFAHPPNGEVAAFLDGYGNGGDGSAGKGVP